MLFNGEAGVVRTLDDTYVTINFINKDDDSCHSCGLKAVCAPGNRSERTLTLPNPGNLSVGQQVRLEETSNLEFHLALIQFGLPLSAFLVGLILGHSLPQEVLPRELLAFLSALLALGLSFFCARHLMQRIADIIPDKYLRIVARD